MRDHTSVEVRSLPACDLCVTPTGPAAYDAKTIHGPWANLCEEHFSEVGIGLGLGLGQRYVLTDPNAAPMPSADVLRRILKDPAAEVDR